VIGTVIHPADLKYGDIFFLNPAFFIVTRPIVGRENGRCLVWHDGVVGKQEFIFRADIRIRIVSFLEAVLS